MRTLFLIVLVLAAQLSGRLAAAPNPAAEDDKATETWAQEAAVRLKSLSSKTQTWQATPPDDATLFADFAESYDTLNSIDRLLLRHADAARVRSPGRRRWPSSAPASSSCGR